MKPKDEAAEAAARRRRLAEALRDNLKRRKSQSRRRAEGEASPAARDPKRD
ncbi:hypothetical protein [Desertibaculum subflavum]|uniref:hypothetical protein n=1 Tax=Desertibaculum subflavum TaxID=2268458 RepID=UPI0013C52595